MLTANAGVTVTDNQSTARDGFQIKKKKSGGCSPHPLWLFNWLEELVLGIDYAFFFFL